MGELRVKDLLSAVGYDLRLELVSGEAGLDRVITVPYVQKPGLALTGYTKFLVKNRIQVFGKTEIQFLNELSKERQREIMCEIFKREVACCIVTRGQEIPESMIRESELAKTPVLRTELLTPHFIQNVTRLLEAKFAQRTLIHGVLLDVFGVGILILGRAGIGKSESALDLILRGHRLVADDAVILTRGPSGAIHGQAPKQTKHYLEIRGLGVIDIKQLFGVSATRDRKKVQLVVRMEDWDEKREYDRTGFDEAYEELLGEKLPLLVLPVRPGRYLTPIIEVAARNYLLKRDGHFAAAELEKKIHEVMKQKELLDEEELDVSEEEVE